MKEDKNHIPIIMDMKRGGATLVTRDSPMGERYNSPIVKTHVVNTSQDKFERETSGVITRMARERIRKAPPAKKLPIAIFLTELDL